MPTSAPKSSLARFSSVAIVARLSSDLNTAKLASPTADLRTSWPSTLITSSVASTRAFLVSPWAVCSAVSAFLAVSRSPSIVSMWVLSAGWAAISSATVGMVSSFLLISSASCFSTFGEMSRTAARNSSTLSVTFVSLSAVLSFVSAMMERIDCESALVIGQIFSSKTLARSTSSKVCAPASLSTYFATDIARIDGWFFCTGWITGASSARFMIVATAPIWAGLSTLDSSLNLSAV